jgi:hypothetical protein
VHLSDYDKSRVRYHLGYFTVSIPAGDYARLEEALNTIPDSYFYDKIVIQLGRCDTAEKKTKLLLLLIHDWKRSSVTLIVRSNPVMLQKH